MRSDQPEIELDEVLSAMAEGVIVVDAQERILKFNGVAAELMGLPATVKAGINLSDIVTNSPLITFIRTALTVPKYGKVPVEFTASRDRIFQAYVRKLSRDNKSVMLVVLTDITRLRRLEEVRRDLVANVSHELKTPVTSIKGFVETLLDGALENRADAERFLGIISRQADRLSHIFEDLLTLARLEEGSQSSQKIMFETITIAEVLNTAMENTALQAHAKGITVQIDCEADIGFYGSKRFLEQAAVNLIENAIRYSDSASPILVRAQKVDDGVRIDVVDNGCGIAEQHLSRLFERFYRVDPARSRKAGGTGLGLSIVKHIAQIHGGHASVQSVLGKGSTFSIHLPLAQG